MIYLIPILLTVSLYACRKVYNSSNNILYDNVSIRIVFFSLLMISGMRYEIGTDYENYRSIFYLLNGYASQAKTDINNLYTLEPGYILINYFFGYFPGGFYLVIFFVCCITLFFLFKSLSALNGDYKYLALLIIILHAFVFLMQNQIRQAASIAIFIYSIRYVNSGNYVRFFFINAFSALLFHYSAIMLLPIYAVRYFKFNSMSMAISIAFIFVLSSIGFFQNTFSQIISSLPIYSVYINSDTYSSNSSLSIVNIITIIYFSFLLILFNNGRNESKIFFIGIVLFCAFSNFSILLRLSNYLLYVKIISIPLLISDMNNSSNRRVIGVSFLIYSLLMYVNAAAINSGGNFPYRSLLGIAL